MVTSTYRRARAGAGRRLHVRQPVRHAEQAVEAGAARAARRLACEPRQPRQPRQARRPEPRQPRRTRRRNPRQCRCAREPAPGTQTPAARACVPSRARRRRAIGAPRTRRPLDMRLLCSLHEVIWRPSRNVRLATSWGRIELKE